MNKVMKAAMIAFFLLAATPVLAQTPAAPAQTAPAAKYSVQTSKLGELAANPATKATFLKYFPEVVNHPQFNEGVGIDTAGCCAVFARRRDAGKASRDGCRIESPAVNALKTKRTTKTTKPNGAGIARA